MKHTRTILRKDIKLIFGKDYIANKKSRRFRWYELLRTSNISVCDKVLTAEQIKAVHLINGKFITN